MRVTAAIELREDKLVSHIEVLRACLMGRSLSLRNYRRSRSYYHFTRTEEEVVEPASQAHVCLLNRNQVRGDKTPEHKE